MKPPPLTVFFVLLSIQAASQDDLIKQQKEALPHISDSSNYVDALNRIAMLSYEQSPDTTISYAIKARSIAERLNYTNGIADAINNIGVFFDINGNSDMALRYYSDAHGRYILLKDSSNIIQTLMNIAMVYHGKGDDNKAIPAFEKAIRLGALLRKDSIVSLLLYNYILQYPQRLSPSITDQYIDSATHIAQRYRDKRLLIAIKQLRANQYLQSNHRDTAILLLQKALADGMQEKLFYMALDLLIQLGDIQKENDPKQAILYYKQALSIVREKNYLSYELDLTNRLLDLYSKIGDKAKIQEYSTALLLVYKKMKELDNQAGIDYISYALKDQEFKTIQEKSNYDHNLLWLQTFAILLILVICLILWRNIRKSRKTNTILQRQHIRLTSATKALEESNMNYARLMRIVAHDLRNPIGAISSLAGIKANDADRPPKDKQWIALIQTSAQRCLTLITELLDADFNIRPEKLNKTPTDPTTLATQTIMGLLYRANEKHQQLLSSMENSPSILADQEKITRVLENLTVNAIKFSPPSSSIMLKATTTASDIIFSVQDSGIGIPPELGAKIFEPFANSVRRSGTAGEPSYGLGLYICRQIVEAHNGRIWFQSEAGSGTTFYFSLPLSSLPTV